MKVIDGKITVEISFEEISALNYLLTHVTNKQLSDIEMSKYHIEKLCLMQKAIGIWLVASSSSS